MRYDDMIHSLAERGTASLAHLCPARQAALTAALMEEVGTRWRSAFITDAPHAIRYPELLNQALKEAITPQELGQALIDGAIDYATQRVERDLRRSNNAAARGRHP
jgi:hypothetical protein